MICFLVLLAHIFILLPCCFWINVDKLDDSLLKRILRALIFLCVFLLEAGGGLLLRVIFILQENWDYGKKASDFLILWEKDPHFSLSLLSPPSYALILFLWCAVVFLCLLACTGVYLSLKTYRKRYLFFFILVPLFAFPSFFCALHFHRERENVLFFNEAFTRAHDVLLSSEKSREEKCALIRKYRENFPVTYEKPLWKNIKNLSGELKKKI